MSVVLTCGNPVFWWPLLATGPNSPARWDKSVEADIYPGLTTSGPSGARKYEVFMPCPDYRPVPAACQRLLINTTDQLR